MVEYLKKVSAQVAEFFKSLSPVRKAALVGTSVAVIGGIIALFMWAGESVYQPLMTNLNPEDSTSVMRLLREKHIPFRVDNGGRTISIPPESVHELRLELATMGMPQSSIVGYEVFDKSNLGTTTFVQRMNQKRALEGELMRTINSIKGVKRSRVHLAMPPKSTFVEDQKKSTASVVLDVEPGTILNEKQIQGIGTLVARAVEGMEVSDVVIVDSNGKTLSKNNSDPLAGAAVAQLDVRMKFEQETERRIEEMLSRVVGEGKVVAKVTAEFDFSQTNEVQTTYDSDGAAVKSTEKRNDSLSGVRPGPMGAPGVASNAPGTTGPQVPEIRNDTNKSHEIVNYNVPQTTRNTMRPSGVVKKLSVAVVVDGKSVKDKDKDGNVVARVDPWAPEKLKELEQIVASAVGIDKKRGDVLEIKNLEFTHVDLEEAQKIVAENEKKSYIMKLVTYAVVTTIIILFFVLVVRPFIKWVTENTIDSVDSFLPQTIEELEKLQKGAALPGLEDAMPVLPDRVDPEKVEGEMIKDKIVTLVEANPQKAALVLRDWIYASAANAKGGETAGGPGKSKTG